MSKISIITTTYKHEKFISQTIDSILSQTFTDWELLIGDDSTDNKTRDIIKIYVKKYPGKIKAWHHTINKGIVDNINFLLDYVNNNSKYIAFLEGDDLFTPDNLNKKIKIFNKNTNVKLVYNNLDFIDLNGKIFCRNILDKKVPFYLKNEKLTKEQLIKYESFYISYSTLMFNKDVLNKEKILNPTKDKLYTVSDWDLFFRISSKYNCYGINDSLTQYRRYGGNISLQYLKLFSDLEIQIKEYLKKGLIDKKLFNIKLSFINLLKSVAYLKKIDRKNSLILLFKSFNKNSFFKNFHYKVAIFIINILPGFIIKYVFKKIIKR